MTAIVTPDLRVTVVVVATFALLFFRRIRVYPLTRAVTAATGAAVVVAMGGITPAQAVESVDAGTILLLFGMLAHVAALARSGFYAWVAAWIVRRAGTLRRLTVGTLCLAAALSALALNDAVVLLLTPVLVRAVDRTDTDPVPPLLAVIFGANIGSVATPLGNPQNAYILSRSGLTTVEFVTALAPIALVALAVAGGWLWLSVDATPIDETVPAVSLDAPWALSSVTFLVGTFVLLAALPGVNAGVVAAAMGVFHVAWLQLFRRLPGDELLADLDWSILVLFVGLFVLVGSLEGTALATVLRRAAGGSGLAVVTFGLSNLVSNVPAVVFLSTAATTPTDWYLLAAVSTLAGNATPIASAATLIVLDQASRRGVDVPVRRLLRTGVPLAAVTSGLATVLLVG